MWSELSWEGTPTFTLVSQGACPAAHWGPQQRTAPPFSSSLFFKFGLFCIYPLINTQYWASKWTAAQNNRAPLVCLYKGDAAEHCCAGLHIVRYIRPRTVGGVMQRLRFPFAACHFLFTDIRFYSGPRFLLSSCISKTKCTHRCEQGS